MVEAYASTEAEFLDVIGAKVFEIFLLAIHSHPSTNGKERNISKKIRRETARRRDENTAHSMGG